MDAKDARHDSSDRNAAPAPLDESAEGSLPVEDPRETRVGYQRDETRAERLDRNWKELLQEIRVLQTGSQILAAFLIVLPFQSRFDQLDTVQTGWYLGLVMLSLVIVGLLLTPVAVHRHLFRKRIKDEMVVAANQILRLVLALIGVLLTGVAAFIADFVIGRPAALIAGAAVGLLMMTLLMGVPRLIGRAAPR